MARWDAHERRVQAARGRLSVDHGYIDIEEDGGVLEEAHDTTTTKFKYVFSGFASFLLSPLSLWFPAVASPSHGSLVHLYRYVSFSLFPLIPQPLLLEPHWP